MTDFFNYRNNQLCAEQVPLADIAQRFGTPCYVYSHAALTDGYRQFADALKGREHLICYAVKVNSNLAILNLLAKLGAGFDIVSGGELQRVLAAGFAMKWPLHCKESRTMPRSGCWWYGSMTQLICPLPGKRTCIKRGTPLISLAR